MSETTECLEITRETSKKVDMVVEAYQKKDRECDSKDSTIKHLLKTTRLQAVVGLLVIGACFLLFIYSYFYAPYAAGNVNANNDGDGNAVVSIG